MAPCVACVRGGGSGGVSGIRGRREFFRDLDEAFVEIQIEFAEIRDLGDRIVATGHLRMRGKPSGAATESPLGYVIDFKNGKIIRAETYLVIEQTLEVAGLSE